MEIKKPETKSARVQLLLKPSTRRRIDVVTKKYGVSLNEFMNQAAEEKLERHGE